MDRPQRSAFASIGAIDYTVIFVRDMAAMQRFYADVRRFAPIRELSANWIEYRVGANVLALATPGMIPNDVATPKGSASLQLAFRVPPPDVDRCAAELAQHDVTIVSQPTDRPFGHRTLFFRDPDGNLLEIYAEIAPFAAATPG